MFLNVNRGRYLMGREVTVSADEVATVNGEPHRYCALIPANPQHTTTDAVGADLACTTNTQTARFSESREIDMLRVKHIIKLSSYKPENIFVSDVSNACIGSYHLQEGNTRAYHL
jgi:hypothetical protein